MNKLEIEIQENYIIETAKWLLAWLIVLGFYGIIGAFMYMSLVVICIFLGG